MLFSVCFMMAKTKEEKEAVIDDVRDVLNHSNFAFIIDYKGVTVSEFIDLRERIRLHGGWCKVAKNTLMRKAVKADENWQPIEEFLKGQSALMGVKDDISGALRAYKSFQKDKKKTELRGGVMEGRALNKEQVEALATLPSKEQLMGQLAETLSAVIARIAVSIKKIPTSPNLQNNVDKSSQLSDISSTVELRSFGIETNSVQHSSAKGSLGDAEVMEENIKHTGESMHEDVEQSDEYVRLPLVQLKRMNVDSWSTAKNYTGGSSALESSEKSEGMQTFLNYTYEIKDEVLQDEEKLYELIMNQNVINLNKGRLVRKLGELKTDKALHYLSKLLFWDYPMSEGIKGYLNECAISNAVSSIWWDFSDRDKVAEVFLEVLEKGNLIAKQASCWKSAKMVRATFLEPLRQLFLYGETHELRLRALDSYVYLDNCLKEGKQDRWYELCEHMS